MKVPMRYASHPGAFTASADREHILLEASLCWLEKEGRQQERRTVVELRNGEQSLVYLGAGDEMPDVWVNHGSGMDATPVVGARPRHLLLLLQANLLIG